MEAALISCFEQIEERQITKIRRITHGPNFTFIYTLVISIMANFVDLRLSSVRRAVLRIPYRNDEYDWKCEAPIMMYDSIHMQFKESKTC